MNKIMTSTNKKQKTHKSSEVKYRSIKYKIYLYFLIGIISLSILSGIIYYFRYSIMTDKSVNTTLRTAANFMKMNVLYSGFLEDEIFYNPDNKKYKKFWDDIVILKNEAGIEFIYIMEKRDDDKFYFIFDSGSEGEKFDAVIEEVHLQEYEEAPEEVFTAYDTQEIVFPKEIVEDKWGSYKSVFIPVEDSSGKIYVIGIDIKVDNVNHEKFVSILFIGFTILLSIISSFIFTILMKRIVITPIEKLKDKTLYLTKGDLTIDFVITGKKDEIYELSFAFNKTIETLKELISKVFVAIIVLTKNLKTLFKSSTAVADSANFQASTVEETQRNFENMNNMVETITIETDKASNHTEQALKKARDGMDSMEKLEGEMIKIESSSKEITNIIEMINDIAEQTNLLSLNASIESARAGEAGKGFNIVATEIRKLAEKSTNAANRIQELINNNNKIIVEGVKFSKATMITLKDISFANELITGIVRSITTEVQKVKISSSEILKAISHISDIAQNNLIESEKVSVAMNDFVTQTLELQKFVGQFDVRSEKIKMNQSHIEDVLKAKLIEVNKILSEYGSQFLPTGNIVKIKDNSVQELQIGNLIVTGNVELVDSISRKTNTSVTIFQTIDDALIRVATTVRNFDDTRAIGTIITKESKVYQTVMTGKVYFGRAFVVNKWFVAVYKPIMDETGFILGVIYLGIPEMLEGDENLASDLTESEDQSIVGEEIF